MPSKEGAAVVTPKGGACEAGYTKTTLLPEPEQEKLEQILPYVSFVKEGVDKKPTIQFSRANLQVVNGLGKTNSFNGVGNLIIGYDEDSGVSPTGLPHEQTGSHNLVLGEEQTYTKYASLLGGSYNVATAPFSVVFGHEDTASANYASIGGGTLDRASGEYATVGGGRENEASGKIASIAGGQQNAASGRASSVAGGELGRASGEYSSVSAGQENEAEGTSAAVASGMQNHAFGAHSAVTGGVGSLAQGAGAVVAGGYNSAARAEDSWIAGGAHNQTGPFAQFSVVLGKELQEATSAFEVKD